ncbi:MAG: 2-oxoacid:acceptor oxidoreductase family protein [Bryobacterales bacterium]|nr:2-oxoacid:acceptor oxidoreductase family protein [Bryobacterales bacterium]
MLTEIRFAGFGGQGILLAANIVGRAAAIYEGGYATMTQSYGPEARGGASSAQVLLSDEPILYPYTTHEDILVALSQEAFTRFAPNMKPDGLLLVEEELVRVEGLRGTERMFGIPATRLAEELGKRVVLNIVMVGFFAALSGLGKPESYHQAIAASVPKGLIDLNLKAFEKGYEFGDRAAHRPPSEETAIADLAWHHP